MTQPQKIIVVIVVIVLAVGLIWSLKGKRASAPSSTEPIKIGGIFALSGIGSAPGQEELKGAQLAVDEINARGGVLGQPLKLIAEDLSLDKLKNAGAVGNKLIAIDKVVAIVGPQWDEPAGPILPIIEEAKVPAISADTTDSVESGKSYEYGFSVWPDSRVGIQALLKFAQSKELNRVAIIRLLNGGFWNFTRDEFVEGSKSHGITVVADENTGNPSVTDFRSTITKIKNNKPDAIFIVISDPSQCGFMKQIKELKLDVPVLGTENNGSFVSLKQCPELLEKSYFSQPRGGLQYQAFANEFVKKHGNTPQYPSTMTAYDAVRVIAVALEQTKGQGGERLQQVIAKTKAFQGASLDNITFNSKGFVITPPDAYEVRTVRNGQFVEAK